MITRVLDERGDVLHDCVEGLCEISWDGYALRPLTVDHPDQVDDAGEPVRVKLAKGERVPNADEPDLERYDVRGSTAKLKTDR